MFDPKTCKLKSIPAAELSPKLIQARLLGLGLEELCWIDPKGIDPNTPYQHPPFDEVTRGNLGKILDILRDVCPDTLDQWEDRFRRDAHPENEIAIWEDLAEVFEEFAGRSEMTPAEKKDLYRILVRCSTCRYEYISEVIPSDVLRRPIVHEIVQAYYGQPELKAEAALKPAIEYPDPFGGDSAPGGESPRC